MADSSHKKTFTGDFKRFFGRGLTILLPSVLTLWLLVQAYLFVERQVAAPINAGIRAVVLWATPKVLPGKRLPDVFIVSDEELAEFRFDAQRNPTPEARVLLRLTDPELRTYLRKEEFRRFWDAHWYFRFIGLVVAITLIYLAGILLGGLIGRRLYRRIENFFLRVPLIGAVYPHVKQLVDLILGERQMAFRRVVMVEYPRKGIWTIGLVTSGSMKAARAAAGGDVVAVFIPSTPTPFTGFTITVPAKEAIDVPITVDEAIRFFITGGVLVPDRQKTDSPDNIALDRVEQTVSGPLPESKD